MSIEINSLHQKSGVKKKGRVHKVKSDIADTNCDIETNDFDYKAEKPPARSSYVKLWKVLDKRIKLAKTVPVCNSFDRLKLCVDLRVYASEIEFERVAMVDEDNPDNPNPYVGRILKRKRQMKVALSPYLSLLNTTTKSIDKLDETELLEGLVFGIGDYHNESEDSPEDDEIVEVEEEPMPVRNGVNLYSNCWVERKDLPLGLNALYIKDDYLVIDVTGKWMADIGCLGCINIHNIAKCLMKIRNLNFINFNIPKMIEAMTVRLCDVTVDVQTDKRADFVRAVSAIYPFYSAMNTIRKYNDTSVFIKSKADTTRKSFVIYDKGIEVGYNRKNSITYRAVIGDEGVEIADKTLRLELHLNSFENMRKYLDLPEGEIKLVDLLKSQAPVMLDVLNDYNISETKLRDKIKSHTERFLPEVKDFDDLTNILAAEQVAQLQASKRVVELLQQQGYEFSALRDLVALDYNIADNPELMNRLNPYLRDCCYTYLLHYKPKHIKLLLELLDLLHSYYGRNSEELPKSA